MRILAVSIRSSRVDSSGISGAPAIPKLPITGKNIAHVNMLNLLFLLVPILSDGFDNEKPLDLIMEKSRGCVFPGGPSGVRTRVVGVRGRYPRPLDDGTK